MDSACFPISLLSAIDLKPLICQKVSIHHLPGLGGLDKLENQATLQNVRIKKHLFCECCTLTQECWYVCVCVHIHLFVLTSPNYNRSPAVFTVLRARWFNQLPDWWIDCRNRLQITLTSPSLSTLKWSAVLECKFPPQSAAGIDSLCVRGVDSSKALSSSAWRCSGLSCLADKWVLQAHPSLES